MKPFIKNPANPIFVDEKTGTMFDVYVQPWSGEKTTLENPRYRMDVSWRPQCALVVTFSEDGIHWKKNTVNPIMVRNRYKECEQARVGGSQVMYVEGLGYLMFYIGYKDIDTACICCALSKDGKTQWRRCKANPLVEPTKGEWDGDACYKPGAMYDEEKGGWHIWYNGRKGAPEYIGEAFMEGTFTEDDFE